MMKYLRRRPGHIDVPLLPRQPAPETVTPEAIAALPEYAVAYLAGAQNVIASWVQLCRLARTAFGLDVTAPVLQAAVEAWTLKHVSADANTLLKKKAKRR